MADLPPLTSATPKQSALTQRLASLSPKSPKTLASSSSFPQPPSSPSRSSPQKQKATPVKRPLIEFALPITPVSLPRKQHAATTAIPQTPATRSRISSIPFPSTPQTPRTLSSESSLPSTPVHQKGAQASTAPETPSTSRRAALYERIRKRSEVQAQSSPTKNRVASTSGMTRDQLMKLSQEELRRRCLLGRLGGVAESIWM